MSQTVLVTCATGKTARRLIPLLVRRGVTVRAASRIPTPNLTGVEPVRFDWSDPSTYEAARKGADAIYIVPDGYAVSGDPGDRVGSLLDGAAGAGVRRVVLLSAFGMDQAPPEDPLRRAELAVEACGIPGTIVRPGSFMQNFSERHWSRLDEGIRERDEIVMPGGDAPISWVSTEDIAAVTAIALIEDGHEGKGYALTGPEPLALPAVAAQISVAAGRPIKYVEAGPEWIRSGLLGQGIAPQLAEYLTEMYSMALGGAFGALTDDVRNVTGRPPVSFAEFATGAAAAWRR